MQTPQYQTPQLSNVSVIKRQNNIIGSIAFLGEKNVKFVFQNEKYEAL